VAILFLRRQKKLKVDIRELEGEKESLFDFLRSKLRIEITASKNELSIDSENLSPKELKRFVNKFIYHRSLMNKYWVALTDNVVKVKKFKHVEKHEKKQKEKRTPPSTIKHGW